MRLSKHKQQVDDITLFALDDDPLMVDTLRSYFQGVGFKVDTDTEPLRAIERIREGQYDILILDFLMTPICGDQVVEQIRQFNQDIFIILLTGHKSLAPPIKTIRNFDIQAYYEKSDRFDQLELLVESCVKSIRQMKLIRKHQKDTAQLTEALPELYCQKDPQRLGQTILKTAGSLWSELQGLLLVIVTHRPDNQSPLAVFRSGNLLANFNSPQLPGWLQKMQTVAKDQPKYMFSQLTDPQEQVLGGLLIKLKNPPSPYQSQLFQLFQLFSSQISGVLTNYANTALLNNNYLEMIKAIRKMVDARDIYTSGHSDRVSYLAHRLAMYMGKDDAFCERVRVAGLFHDIGKLAVPDRILLSDQRLEDEDRQIINKHPLYGYNMLESLSLFKNITEIIYSHHERIDGKGYPDGLKGDEIPEEARMITIADAFDAMSSHRRYRQSKTHEEAIEELIRCSGTQFEAEYVKHFIAMLSEDRDAIEADLASLKKAYLQEI